MKQNDLGLSNIVSAANFNNWHKYRHIHNSNDNHIPSPSPTSSSLPTATPKETPIMTTTATPSLTPKPRTRTPRIQTSPIFGAISTPTGTPLATSATTSAGVAFGVAIEDFTNAQSELSSVSDSLNKMVSTVSIYKQFGNQSGSTFSDPNLNYIKSHGIKILLAWEPWNPEKGMSQPTDYLKDIVAGKDDTYIKSFANEVKAYGNPVTIRFGHEMNGDWYPWGERPKDYIAAYRYIYNAFLKEGVKNVRWMWCVNVFYDSTDLQQYYPGDDVVDVIGIDGFNWGTTTDAGWQSFSEVFKDTYDYLTNKYTKPITIAETASTEFGGNKATWINSMFRNELPTSFPKIHELIWFDYLKETDWRVNSSASSLNAFKNNLIP